jgi:hypothetical protein
MKRCDFAYFIKEKCLNNNIVEIGVNNGNYSQCFVDNSNAKNIYLVDPWEEEKKEFIKIDRYGDKNEQNDRFNYVCNRFKNNLNVKILRMKSLDAANHFQDDFFDFIYVDALHEYQYVVDDLLAWYPKLKLGGLFSGHDYKQSCGKIGVYKAVNEFAEKNNKEIFVTKERCPSWYFFK